MPRPKRGRPAIARLAKAAAHQPADTEPTRATHDDARDQQEEFRGRSRRTRSAGRLSLGEEDAIREANKSRDAALKRLANEDATTTTSGPTAGDDDSDSPVELGRRSMATPAQNRRDTTGLDLGDSVFGDLDDSFADGDIPDGVRSNDLSTMSYSAHRSRSRKSSFVGRNDPPIRPSSRSGTTPGVSSSFNIGVFKRRAREPSILGTSLKPAAQPSQSARDSDLDSEDDFQPEAESTPLNNRRKTRDSRESERQGSPEVAGPSSTRKRKSEDVQQNTTRPEKLSRRDAEPAEDLDRQTSSGLSDAPPSPERQASESDSDLSDISSPQEPIGLIQRPVTPMNEEEITAPPASSGSEGGGYWPDIRTLAKKRRRPSVTTPTRLDNLSDVSSPPSLTHSPNYEESRVAKPRGRQATRQQTSPNVTTADLTSLLPKRRYKKQRDPLGLESDEELDTTGLGDEDDELSYLDTRASRRRKGSRPPSRATSRRPASRGGRAGNSALKPKHTPSRTKPVSHGRRSDARPSSDKENEEEDVQSDADESEDEQEESRFAPLADDTFEVETGSSGEVLSADELKKAARKFKEVDRWELEFEEMTEEASPQDAR